MQYNEGKKNKVKKGKKLSGKEIMGYFICASVSHTSATNYNNALWFITII